ncbi:lipase family protein, partial [Pseudoalteromonas prydzensis]|nr:lipase family protein [Pseudoalteromonas prydzensis]
MNTLSPTIAANFAALAYTTVEKAPLAYTDYYLLLKNSFSFESESIKGVSGSILERVFNHSTNFGCIA